MVKFTFMVLNLNSILNINKLHDFLEKNYNSYELLELTDSDREPLGKSHKVLCFEEFTKPDEAINSAASIAIGKNLVLIRTFNENKLDEFNLMTKTLETKNQIVVFNNEKNAFKSFFEKITNKIYKPLFGYTFYNCKLSAICIGEDFFETIKTSNNPSLLTKINRWICADIKYIDGGERVKIAYDKLDITIKILASSFVMITLIALSIIFESFFSKIYILIPTLLFILISFVLLLSYFVKLISYVKVGNIYYKKAKYKIKEILDEKN